VKLLSQFFNEVFDKTIVNHISISGFQVALPFPYIIWNMVTSYSEGQCFLRQPEVRQNRIYLIIVCWREHQNKSCNIRSTGKVKSTVADSSTKEFWNYRSITSIPFFHWHPSNRLFYPLIQTQLSECVLFTRILSGRIASSFNFIHSDSNAKRGICFFPNFWRSPVFRFICTVNHRIECWIDFSAFQNIFCLLMRFITNRMRVRPSRGDEKIQRLHSGITRTFGHNIKELSVWLRMQFIEHHSMDVETMLGIRLCRKHLIEAVGRNIHDTLL